MTAPYQWPKQLFRSPTDWGDSRFLFTEAELITTVASLKAAGGGYENISTSDAEVFEVDEIGPNGDEALYYGSFQGTWGKCQVTNFEWIKVSNSNPDPVFWEEEGFGLSTPDTFHHYDPEDPEDVEIFRSKVTEHN